MKIKQIGCLASNVAVSLLVVFAGQAGFAKGQQMDVEQIVVATGNMEGPIPNDHIVLKRSGKVATYEAFDCKRGAVTMKPEPNLPKCTKIGDFSEAMVLRALYLTNLDIKKTIENRGTAIEASLVGSATLITFPVLPIMMISVAEGAAVMGILSRVLIVSVPLAATNFVAGLWDSRNKSNLDSFDAALKAPTEQHTAKRLVAEIGLYARNFGNHLLQIKAEPTESESELRAREEMLRNMMGKGPQ